MSRQVVAAVGYDDKIKIYNSQCEMETTGALLIQNSCGNKWGNKGYAGCLINMYMMDMH